MGEALSKALQALPGEKRRRSITVTLRFPPMFPLWPPLPHVKFWDMNVLRGREGGNPQGLAL